MADIRGLAEIVLFVQDIERSLAFYRDLLGLTIISPPASPAAFLRVGGEREAVPQQIVLIQRPEGVQRAGTRRSERDLHHIGLEVEAAELESWRTQLSGAGLEVRTGEHPFLPVEAIYVNDPDGYEIEIVAKKA